MSKRILLIVTLIALAVIIAACAPAPTPAPTAAPKPAAGITFGIVLVGPYNDHGWSEAHYAAAQYVKSKLPGSDFIYLDKLNPADRPGTTLEQVVNDMKSKGVRLILTTSDDFQTDTIITTRLRMTTRLCAQ